MVLTGGSVRYLAVNDVFVVVERDAAEGVPATLGVYGETFLVKDDLGGFTYYKECTPHYHIKKNPDSTDFSRVLHMLLRYDPHERVLRPAQPVTICQRKLIDDLARRHMGVFIPLGPEDHPGSHESQLLRRRVGQCNLVVYRTHCGLYDFVLPACTGTRACTDGFKALGYNWSKPRFCWWKLVSPELAPRLWDDTCVAITGTRHVNADVHLLFAKTPCLHHLSKAMVLKALESSHTVLLSQWPDSPLTPVTPRTQGGVNPCVSLPSQSWRPHTPLPFAAPNRGSVLTPGREAVTHMHAPVPSHPSQRHVTTAHANQTPLSFHGSTPEQVANVNGSHAARSQSLQPSLSPANSRQTPRCPFCSAMDPETSMQGYESALSQHSHLPGTPGTINHSTHNIFFSDRGRQASTHNHEHTSSQPSRHPHTPPIPKQTPNHASSFTAHPGAGVHNHGVGSSPHSQQPHTSSIPNRPPNHASYFTVDPEARLHQHQQGAAPSQRSERTLTTADRINQRQHCMSACTEQAASMCAHDTAPSPSCQQPHVSACNTKQTDCCVCGLNPGRDETGMHSQRPAPSQPNHCSDAQTLHASQPPNVLHSSASEKEPGIGDLGRAPSQPTHCPNTLPTQAQQHSNHPSSSTQEEDASLYPHKSSQPDRSYDTRTLPHNSHQPAKRSRFSTQESITGSHNHTQTPLQPCQSLSAQHVLTHPTPDADPSSTPQNETSIGDHAAVPSQTHQPADTRSPYTSPSPKRTLFSTPPKAFTGILNHAAVASFQASQRPNTLMVDSCPAADPIALSAPQVARSIKDRAAAEPASPPSQQNQPQDTSGIEPEAVLDPAFPPTPEPCIQQHAVLPSQHSQHTNHHSHTTVSAGLSKHARPSDANELSTTPPNQESNPAHPGPPANAQIFSSDTISSMQEVPLSVGALDVTIPGADSEPSVVHICVDGIRTGVTACIHPDNRMTLNGDPLRQISRTLTNVLKFKKCSQARHKWTSRRRLDKREQEYIIGTLTYYCTEIEYEEEIPEALPHPDDLPFPDGLRVRDSEGVVLKGPFVCEHGEDDEVGRMFFCSFNEEANGQTDLLWADGTYGAGDEQLRKHPDFYMCS